jgi:hypothetical protein
MNLVRLKICEEQKKGKIGNGAGLGENVFQGFSITVLVWMTIRVTFACSKSTHTVA